MRIDSDGGTDTEEGSVDVEKDTWVWVTKVWNLGHIRTGLAEILIFREILSNDFKKIKEFFTSKTSKRLKYIKGIKKYEIVVWWGLKNFFYLKNCLKSLHSTDWSSVWCQHQSYASLTLFPTGGGVFPPPPKKKNRYS